jgi:H+/Cl- antiporter ClcA
MAFRFPGSNLHPPAMVRCSVDIRCRRFLAGGLLMHFIPEARGSSIPQTIIAHNVYTGRTPLWVWLGMFFLGALNVCSGPSLGREDPTVQICAGLPSWLRQIFSL